jgi:hypothetical protein
VYRNHESPFVCFSFAQRVASRHYLSLAGASAGSIQMPVQAAEIFD